MMATTATAMEGAKTTATAMAAMVGATATVIEDRRRDSEATAKTATTM